MKIYCSTRDDTTLEQEEDMAQTRMNDTSEKENESEIINSVRRELEVMKKKNEQLEREKEEMEKEKEEMKRRMKEKKSRIPQPINRSYLTSREGIYNRLNISNFEKFMDGKYSAEQDKITKSDEITVVQKTGEVRGYTGFMEEMMDD